MAAVLCEGARQLEQAINQKIDEHRENELKRKKEGGIDPSLPEDPFNDPDLEETSHPEEAKKGRHQFRNKKTGAVIYYDKGKSDKNGHGHHDHYHRPNPDSKGKHDYYLDENGDPVPRNSEESHLYRPEQVWWKQK